MFNSKILTVDDEADICNLITMTLNSNGFNNVRSVNDGEYAIRTAREWHPDLILLDLMIPKTDGLTVCRELKSNKETSDIPIIMITAKNEESDIVLGLELGANDYITKPFSLKVLVARIRSQLRNASKIEKQESLENANILKHKNLTLNSNERSVEIGNKFIKLTYSEFELLSLFLRNQGRVFTRNQLITALRGNDGFDVCERAIDVQILNLRTKLGELGTEIETIRGIGYKLKGE